MNLNPLKWFRKSEPADQTPVPALAGQPAEPADEKQKRNMPKFNSITIDPGLTGRELNLILHYFINITLPDYIRWLKPAGGDLELGHISILKKDNHNQRQPQIMIDEHRQNGSVHTIMNVLWDGIEKDIKLTEPGKYRTWQVKGII